MYGVLLVLGIVTISLCCSTRNPTIPTSAVSIPVDTIPQFMSKSPQDGIVEALDYYGIEHSDIVYAQAVLETGWFKSRICLQYNNLFGLYNSRTKSFYRFNHWSESVIAYKKWIQRRYRSPSDYYQFLVQINYAEDKEYVSKLKKIVSKIENDKRRHTEGSAIPQRL